MNDRLYEFERERVVAAGVETMPLPSRGRDAVVTASRSPEAWKNLALMAASIFSADTSFTTTANATQPQTQTTASSSTPSVSTTPSLPSSSPTQSSATTTTTTTTSSSTQQQTSPQSQCTENACMLSMPSSPQSHTVFNEAAQYYQRQRHQYQTNDDYAAAMAYYRARILSIDSAANSYIATLNKPVKNHSSPSQSPSSPSTNSTNKPTTFMPMIHSLEVDAEDEAGVKPPYCEDVALDLSEYRWRISTRPHRLDLAKKRAEQDNLPFPQRTALTRTSADMGSYARLLAAARMEEKGTQIWTPPKEIIENENNNNKCDNNFFCFDERPLSEVEMMGGYDYAPYLRREDRDAMVSRIAFYPEITHQQACVPDLPFPETAKMGALTKESAEAGLRAAVGKVLVGQGFEEADERALAILTDLAGTLMTRIGLNARIVADNNPVRFSNEFTFKRAWRGMCDAGIPPRKVAYDEAKRREELKREKDDN